MENTKAYNILRIFSSKELIDFSKFLNSPYFNESKNVKKLFEVIRQYHPEYSSVHLCSAELHKRVFGKEVPRVNNSVNNLFTKLIKLAELYLSVSELRNDKLSADNYLLKRYFRSDSRTLFDSRISKVYSEITEKRSFNAEYYHMAYSLKRLEQEYLVKDIYSGKCLVSPLVFSNNTNILFKNFYISVYRDFLKFLMVKVISGTDELILREEQIYKTILCSVPAEMKDFPVFRIYRKFISIYSDDLKPDFLETLKELQSDDLVDFRYDVSYLLKILFHYAKILYDAGFKNSDKNLMNLLEYMTKEKFWFNLHGKISEHAFNYVVRYAVEMNAFEWCEKFINEHTQYLESEDAQSVLYYNLAIYSFFKTKQDILFFPEDFELSLSYLSKVKSTFMLKKLSIYRLMMMIFYETEQTDYFEYQYDNIIHYLKDHKNSMNEVIYDQNLNFAQTICQIMRIKESKNYDKIDKYYNEVKVTEHMEERKWIIENINKLVTKAV